MKLSVIIPTKNEEKSIPTLLNCLMDQTFSDFDIIVADAKSTDKTIDMIRSHQLSHKISIVDGGLPSVGRNNGARQSTSDYLLFIDADASFQDVELIQKAIKYAEENHFDLITTNISCRNNKIVNAIYKVNNLLQVLSKFNKPYSTGMFFLIRRDVFVKLNGFDERDIYAEDYHLSRKIDRKRFGVLRSSRIYSDDRRFKKMGYTTVIGLFAKTIMNRNDESYYRRKIKYHD